jgi:hypothetical protein
VFGRGRDATFASLPVLLSRLDTLEPSPGCDGERLAALRSLAAQLQRDIDDLFARVQEARQVPAAAPQPSGPAQPSPQPSGSAKTTSPRLMRLAEECCALHAKVACLGIWLFNRDHLDDFFADGAWLAAALARKQVHQYELGDLTPSATAQLFARLNAQREGNEFFSIRSIRQAASGAPEMSPDAVPAAAR